MDFDMSLVGMNGPTPVIDNLLSKSDPEMRSMVQASSLIGSDGTKDKKVPMWLLDLNTSYTSNHKELHLSSSILPSPREFAPGKSFPLKPSEPIPLRSHVTPLVPLMPLKTQHVPTSLTKPPPLILPPIQEGKPTWFQQLAHCSKEETTPGHPGSEQHLSNESSLKVVTTNNKSSRDRLQSIPNSSLLMSLSIKSDGDDSSSDKLSLLLEPPPSVALSSIKPVDPSSRIPISKWMQGLDTSPSSPPSTSSASSPSPCQFKRTTDEGRAIDRMIQGSFSGSSSFLGSGSSSGTGAVSTTNGGGGMTGSIGSGGQEGGHPNDGNEGEEGDHDDLVIPQLPTGRELMMEIWSNWGDEDFLGLNGVEIFDSQSALLTKVDQIWMDGSLSDSTIQVLMDNVNWTHDDSHIWVHSLAKQKVPLRIHFVLSTITSIALIRIWNYNKSRIYSNRGIRDIKLFLDGNLIFQGEIAKAMGDLTGPLDRFGDTILFTTDEQILESIGKNDHSFQQLVLLKSF